MADRFDHELEESLNLYLDGRLSEEERRAFESRMKPERLIRVLASNELDDDRVGLDLGA